MRISDWSSDVCSSDLGIPLSQSGTTATAGVTATIPLFQGGLPAARVRQAQAFQSQSIEQAIEIERDVVAQTPAAYASWRAEREAIESSQVAVDAAGLSLEVVRAEHTVGTGTIIGNVKAEQESPNRKTGV